MTSNEVLLTSETTGQLWNVCVWDVESGTSIVTYKGGTSVPRGLAVLGQQYLVSASPTKPVLTLWPLHKRDTTCIKMVCPGNVTALDITEDGDYCVAAIAEKIYIWQTCTGRLLCVLSRHYQTVTCLRCSSGLIVSGGEDSLVIVWSLGKALCEQSQSRTPVSPDQVWSSHSLPVTDLHIGVGGHLARVVSSSLDQTCRLYDVNSGEVLCTFVFEVAICSVVLDSAEFRLFAGSSTGSIYAVNLFETPVRRERHITEDKACQRFDGHEKQVSCLCVSMDGCQLVSGSNDHNVKIWDVFSGQCLRTIEHKGPLTNALLTMVPPGIANPDIKSKLPLQTFQRVFHLDSQEENSKVDLNVLLRGANDEPEEVEDILKPNSEILLDLNYRTKDTENMDVDHASLQEVPKRTIISDDSELLKLKNANKELFHFAVSSLLQNKDK
ncbi:WD repeat-containing protein 18-like isoform X2 [Ostrea edulis]|uniref:WD repeat-containing protein 18-like isoform X2 n=2 Tax=Ostrea edulis TaxID=37623 RepID=UPI002095B29B|nr:WD repeat-containing protein 18-like isoform X2 [Ostrea edulis]